MSSNIERHLEEVIRDLIAQGVDEFWLCCEQGTFDCMARLTLKELKKEFRGISLCLLPAYHPSDAKMEWVEAQDYDLIYPDEVANAPPQVAILRRNDYITKNADYIVCYITHNSGGAYKAVEKARKHKKKIINLAEYI